MWDPALWCCCAALDNASDVGGFVVEDDADTSQLEPEEELFRFREGRSATSDMSSVSRAEVGDDTAQAMLVGVLELPGGAPRLVASQEFVVREGGKQRNVAIVRTSPVKQGSSVRNPSSPFVHISAACLTINPDEHLGDHAQYQDRFLRSGFMEHEKVSYRAVRPAKHAKNRKVPMTDPANWWLYKQTANNTLTYRRPTANELGLLKKRQEQQGKQPEEAPPVEDDTKSTSQRIVANVQADCSGRDASVTKGTGSKGGGTGGNEVGTRSKSRPPRPKPGNKSCSMRRSLRKGSVVVSQVCGDGEDEDDVELANLDDCAEDVRSEQEAEEAEEEDGRQCKRTRNSCSHTVGGAGSESRDEGKGGKYAAGRKSSTLPQEEKTPTSIESDRAQGPKTGRSPELEVNLKALLLIIPEAARDVVKCIVRNANDGVREDFSVSLYNRCLR